MRIASYVKKAEVVVSFTKGKESDEFIQEIMNQFKICGFHPVLKQQKKSWQITFEVDSNENLNYAKDIVHVAQIQQKSGWKK